MCPNHPIKMPGPHPPGSGSWPQTGSEALAQAQRNPQRRPPLSASPATESRTPFSGLASVNAGRKEPVVVDLVIRGDISAHRVWIDAFAHCQLMGEQL